MAQSAFETIKEAIESTKTVDNTQIQKMLYDFIPDYQTQMEELVICITAHRPEYFHH